MFREYIGGGVNLPQRTWLTERSPFQNIAVPYLCRFPLSQHTGKPAVPCVKPGDTVTEGQIIAKADGELSADIHTSVPGRVQGIDVVTTIRGERESAIIIESRGGFPFFHQEKPLDWTIMNPTAIGAAIRSAGIVRLGGSPVPEHLRLPQKGDPSPEILIINAIESEPYLTTAAAMLEHNPEPLVEGAGILMRLTGVPKTVFAVDSRTGRRTVRKLHELISKHGLGHAVSVKKIPQVYPYGADVILADIIAHRRITPGDQPKKHGVLIETAATVHAIYEAVTEHKPLYERFITVSGRGIRKPGNYKIRLGTPLSHVIEECGGLRRNDVVILAGGPMRGKRVDSLDAPIDKKVSALLFLDRKELNRRTVSACIRCGSCIDSCPMGLSPREIFRAKKPDERASRCIGCSVCSYVCPAGLDLAQAVLENMAHARSARS